MTSSNEQLVPVKQITREDRFIVLKRKHLSPVQERELRSYFREQDVPTTECLVVESDWPEYETVWKMIEARITGRSADDIDLNERCSTIADQVVPRYRVQGPRASCSGHIAKKWGAAWDAACIALGGDPAAYYPPQPTTPAARLSANEKASDDG